MKTYIGTKTVKAEPMVLGVYKKATGKDPYPGENKPYHLPGYLIEYPDGYKSWSPADVFDMAYKPAETALDRVNIELSDLMRRTEKLGVFIHNQNEGKDFQQLPVGTRAFLLSQYHTMCNYIGLLSLRQSCMESNEECRPYGLSFDQILPMLRGGFAIRREGWNDKGLMVFKQVPAHITSEIIPKMQSLPDEAKRLILESGDHIDYVSQCLIFNPQTGEANSWVPSISDVFANDWELVM